MFSSQLFFFLRKFILLFGVEVDLFGRIRRGESWRGPGFKGAAGDDVAYGSEVWQNVILRVERRVGLRAEITALTSLGLLWRVVPCSVAKLLIFGKRTRSSGI